MAVSKVGRSISTRDITSSFTPDAGVTIDTERTRMMISGNVVHLYVAGSVSNAQANSNLTVGTIDSEYTPIGFVYQGWARAYNGTNERFAYSLINSAESGGGAVRVHITTAGSNDFRISMVWIAERI